MTSRHLFIVCCTQQLSLSIYLPELASLHISLTDEVAKRPRDILYFCHRQQSSTKIRSIPHQLHRVGRDTKTAFNCLLCTAFRACLYLLLKFALTAIDNYLYLPLKSALFHISCTEQGTTPRQNFTVCHTQHFMLVRISYQNSLHYL